MLNINDFIPLASPNILQEDIDEVNRVLKSGMLVQGAEVRSLEAALEKYLSVGHAICVSNGTASLHLALLALGIGEGDEVIIPAFSYVATANVVEIVGAKPVFVDIDLNTFNIDCSQLRSALSNKTKAIMPVHEFGLSAELEEIRQFAQEFGLKLIEDAACALGGKYQNKMIGRDGDFSSFSFHPRKAITSGEGGVLTTNSEDYAERIRVLRNHGISSTPNGMDFVDAGFNYRMTEFQAALIKSQLKRIEGIIEYKQGLAEIYNKNIVNKGLKLPTVAPGCRHSWQTYHVVLDEKYDRDEVIVKLKNAGVGTNYGAQCIPYVSYYRKKYNLNCRELFPNAFMAYKQGLSLPIYDKLLPEHIYKICEIINSI